MPDPVNLVRPDGTRFQANAADADVLTQAFGYQEETDESRFNRIEAETRESYYEDQGLETFLEGAASGASFGLSDVLFERVLGWDTSERAQYNPGERIAGEITGAVLPAVATFGGSSGFAASALAKTPAGMVSTLATKAGGAGARGMAIAGAIEGAASGAGAQITNATLSGDPVTVESVIAGMGWGTLFGGGLGAALGKVSGKVEAYAAKKAAAELGEDVREIIPSERWGAFRSSVEDARKVVTKAVDDVSAAVKGVKVGATDPLDIQLRATGHFDNVEAAQGKFLKDVDAASEAGGAPARKARVEVQQALNRATTELAEKAPDYAKVEKLFAAHKEKVDEFARLTGVAAPDLAPFTAATAQASVKGLDEVKDLTAIRDAFERFPATRAGFAATSPRKIEQHAAAIDKLMTTGGAEMEGVRSSVKQYLEEMSTAAGAKFEGSPGTQFRALWETVRASEQKAGQEAVTKTARGGILRRAAGYMGGRTVAAGATSRPGKALAYGVGHWAVTGLLGLKGAVTGTISNSVARWAPKITRGARAANLPARVDPLRQRLDGTTDKGKKTRAELMKARSEEIRRAAPIVRDTLYRSLEPVAGQHPQFASALHETASRQFEALTARLPRDPGTMISGMRSMWKPDDVATEVFGRTYEAFQKPVMVARRALEEGSITPEAAKALQQFYPEVWQMVRVGMLERLSDPEVVKKMDINEQAAMGRMLGVTMHSIQTPRFIAAQQAMFRQRNEPQPIRPMSSPSNNPSGGRPAGTTTAQAVTEH